jgi:probable phosphoglycerate mutase
MRAVQTAEYVAVATGLAVEKDARLREYDVGERSGLTMGEFAAEFPERHANWLHDSESRLLPGEETTRQVRHRIVPALRECLDSLATGETGVAVLHGASLRVGLMGLLGWPWELSRSLQVVENCGYCVLTESEERGLRLASYNEKAAGSGHGPDFVSDGPVG